MLRTEVKAMERLVSAAFSDAIGVGQSALSDEGLQFLRSIGGGECFGCLE
jgi:hypothetical protein